ncbi:MAG: hypothetical protein FWH48_09975 [Oscillospiraceae bacterium]|nr:hypothetical protein [Oscillospiraceae bacterium]
MKKIDLLFADELEYTEKINDSYMQDMGLEELAKFLDADAKSYEIFRQTISRPLADAEKIRERQNILKDFIDNPGLAQKLKLICVEIQKNKCQTHYVEAKRILIAYYEILSRSMGVSLELLSWLKNRDIKSATLKDLQSQLECQKQFELLKARIGKIIEYCKTDVFALNIEYGSAFKFRNAQIYQNNQKPHENPENKTNNPILKLFQKKPQNYQAIVANPEAEFYYGDHFIMENEINSISGGVFMYITGVIRDLNKHILSFCDLLARQLSFYIVCLELIEVMKNKNLPTVFPEIDDGKSEIKAKNLYDLGLVLQKNSDDSSVTPNDFDDCGGAYYLISGANQGGKTTFIKSLGIAQLFAQAGIPVAADLYICPIFNNFFSHFSREENEDLNFGKLAEELMRIKASLPKIADNALILFNESFATTTETEGCEIALDIMRALSKTKSKILFVTHNYMLLKNHRELSGAFAQNIKLKSLIVAAGKGPLDRTYRIIEGEPQKEIHTIDFLDSIKK